MTDVFDRYPAFRDRPREAAMLVALLKSRGATADAFAMGEAAVAAAPDSCAVRDAVNAALSVGVPGFHVAMMLDESRNRAYARAIERAVRPGMTVLEIGTGAELLAMMAARAGANVVTCQLHPMVATAATEIIKRNGLDHRITVIAKRSTDLVVGEDLPEPADLVIHEIFGSALVN